MCTELASRFTVQTYIFDPRPVHPLQIVLKRYSPHHKPRRQAHDLNHNTDHNTRAKTLLFVHGAGFHKELWEPVLDDLAALADGQEVAFPNAQPVRLGDIWALDCPNHGDSAALNEGVLSMEDGSEHIFSWEDYARSIYLFANGLGRLTRFDAVDHQEADCSLDVYPFVGRDVVGIGHSMGAVALALSTLYTPPQRHLSQRLKSIILIEPMIVSPTYRIDVSARLVAGAEKRKHIWASRKEAERSLSKSLARLGWDRRCVKRYIKYGLKPVEESVPSNTTGISDLDGPVTLKCRREDEAACYRDPVSPSRLYTGVRPLANRLPVHVVFGAMDDDILPEEKRLDLIDTWNGGIRTSTFASVGRIPGGGHLAPLQNPTAVAGAIFDALMMELRTDTQARNALEVAEGARMARL